MTDPLYRLKLTGNTGNITFRIELIHMFLCCSVATDMKSDPDLVFNSVMFTDSINSACEEELTKIIEYVWPFGSNAHLYYNNNCDK